MVLDAPEVYLSQINASDCTVVHGAIVDDTVCHICGRCPLGGTWNVGGFANGIFYADGDIEIIEDVEALKDGFKARRLLGGCCFVKTDPDETGRRGDISGQA